ncbi:hypothetical protein PORY_002848, partial [Pneumocystis oryctolagi]
METNKHEITSVNNCVSSEDNEKNIQTPLISEMIEFDIRKNRWTCEGKDKNEYEYDEKRGIWILSTDEELIRRQQEAYSVEGVDDSVPINRQKKRKGRAKENEEQPLDKKKPNIIPKNTAVYISNLPLDVTEEEIRETFSKCGVISENIDTGKPRIKIYVNEKGEPKGDAVVVFFREESVKLAIQLLDDTYLRLGDKSSQKMRVQQ